MPESNVVLRPRAAPKKDRLEPVEATQLLGQLLEERAQHFRHITRQTLLDELAAGKNGTSDVMEGMEGMEAADGDTAEGDEQDKAPMTREARMQHLADVRNQMMNSLQGALFNATNILDLISLALSKDPNKNVGQSISHYFQEIPKATLGIAKTAPRPKTEEQLKRDAYEAERVKITSRGARMKALDAATDGILKAATELETEVRKEVTYWDEILSISEKGWSLQRLRKKSRYTPFAIRHGSREANPHFQARGFAPLQMDKDGKIVLDPVLNLQHKRLRVRISDDGEITGTSSLKPHGGSDDTASSIEKSIELARDSLFEEEAFHEMCLETRELIVFGVEMKGDVVHVSLPNRPGRQLLIDLVPLETEEQDELPSVDNNSSSSNKNENDWLAQATSDSLRLLLTHEHRMRHHTRTQSPPPLTSQTLHKRQTRPPHLLHTLLGLFAHVHAIKTLESHLLTLSKTLRNAGLDTTLHISREVTWDTITKMIASDARSRRSLPLIDQILELFVKPLNAVATLTLPSTPSEAITLSVRTYFSTPTYGTEFKITLPPALASLVNPFQSETQTKLDFKFSSGEEAMSYLDWLLSLDLSHGLLGRELGAGRSGWVLDSRISVKGKGNVKEVKVLVGEGEILISVGTAGLGDGGEAEMLKWGVECAKDGEGGLLERVKAAVIS